VSERLAILIPCYNGGDLLLESVASADHLDLAPDACVVLVVDNASTDGSLDRLPTRTATGIPITVVRNETNVGRIGNWNQAVNEARAIGADLALFLFVGDLLLPNGRLAALTDRMRDAGSVIGVATNAFLLADGTEVSRSHRVPLPDQMAEVPARGLARAALQRGAMFFGPLQAHVFRTVAGAAPVFNPDDPTHTDQESVFRLLLNSDAAATICTTPFFGWRAHAKRFHQSMDITARVRSDLRMLHSLAETAAIPMRWPAVHSALLLQYVAAMAGRREWSWPAFHRIRTTIREAGPFDLLALVRLVLRRLRGKTLVAVQDCLP
jgi:glycosyltransferase involved in cell wall biosynthesis